MRRRIFIAIAVIAAAGLVSFGIPLAYAVRRFYVDEETLRLQQLATVAGRSITAASGNDPIELPSFGSSITLSSYDASGKLTSGTGPSTPDVTSRSALAGRPADSEAGGRLVVAVPILDNEAVAGVVRVDESIGVVDGDVHRAWAAMAALALLVAGVAALVSRIVASRITKPVRDVRAAAVALGDGDFTIKVRRSKVTELDDVAEALETTASRLDQVLQRERAFSADASHQLKTPITSLRLLVENELAHPDTQPAHAFETALQYIDQLESTVTNLLALARDVPPTSASTDASELFAVLEERWHGRCAAHGRVLRLSRNGVQRIGASPRALQQVLDVLLENALQHGTGTITVEALDLDRATLISVADEGSGVADPPEQIFERRASGQSGTGIGLALARSLTEAEGGRLTLTRAAPHPEFTIALRDPDAGR